MNDIVLVEQEDWQKSLVDDCKSIITEAVFNSRWELLAGYHALGKRIVTDGHYKKWEQGKAGGVLTDLSKLTEINERDLRRSIQFYNKYPVLDEVPEGKNISWNKMITKYLPNSPHVSHNSGENEWYTPAEFIISAVAVMGAIDLDPASSDKANETVQAKKYYTKKNSGLDKEWRGKVWMNPPYAGELIGLFIAKYAESVKSGNVPEGIVLVNNATETGWFGELVSVSDALIFTNSRVKFIDPQGKQGAPLQGQAIVYAGNYPAKFLKEFSKFGWGAKLD